MVRGKGCLLRCGGYVQRKWGFFMKKFQSSTDSIHLFPGSLEFEALLFRSVPGEILEFCFHLGLKQGAVLIAHGGPIVAWLEIISFCVRNRLCDRNTLKIWYWIFFSMKETLTVLSTSKACQEMIIVQAWKLRIFSWAPCTPVWRWLLPPRLSPCSSLPP